MSFHSFFPHTRFFTSVGGSECSSECSLRFAQVPSPCLVARSGAGNWRHQNPGSVRPRCRQPLFVGPLCSNRPGNPSGGGRIEPGAGWPGSFRTEEEILVGRELGLFVIDPAGMGQWNISHRRPLHSLKQSGTKPGLAPLELLVIFRMCLCVKLARTADGKRERRMPCGRRAGSMRELRES